MASQTAQTDKAAQTRAPERGAAPGVFELRTSLRPEEILSSLDAAARRGQLPGYSHPAGALDAGSERAEFTVEDFGAPFESEMRAVIERGSRQVGQNDLAGAPGATGRPGGTQAAAGRDAAETRPPGSVIRFDLRMKRMLPGVFLAVLVLTVWPGVWLTHSLLRTYFPGYGSPDALWSPTWWWYIPLTAASIPLGMRSTLGKSRKTGASEAEKLIQKISGILASSAEAPADRASTEDTRDR